jgi:hypothetical protein
VRWIVWQPCLSLDQKLTNDYIAAVQEQPLLPTIYLPGQPVAPVAPVAPVVPVAPAPEQQPSSVVTATTTAVVTATASPTPTSGASALDAGGHGVFELALLGSAALIGQAFVAL